MASYDKEINIVVRDSGMDKVTKDVKNLNSSLGDLEETQVSLDKSMQDNKKSVLDNGGAMGLLNAATGGLAQTVKDSVEAMAVFTKESKIGAGVQKAYALVVGSSSGAMKVFRLALVATGIGAIVVALGLLIANFDKVKKAVFNLVPGLAIVGDFISNIVDAITDFIGVTSDATRELDKLAEASAKTLDKNKFFLDAYGDQYDEFTKRKIEARNKLAEQIKAIDEDEALSTEEKLRRITILTERANRDILAADQARADKASENRKKEQDKIDAENAKIASNKKAIQDKKDADAQKLLDDAKAINQKAIEENEKLFSTEQEQLTKKYEAERELLEAQNISITELQTAYWNAQNELNLERDAERYAIDQAARDNKKAADEKAADDEIALEQLIADSKKTIQEQSLEVASGIVGLAKTLGEKSKAVQKAALIAESAIGIAKIVINTQAANAAVTAKYSLIPGGIALAVPEIAFNTISAGIGIATTVAATAKGLAALGGGGSAGGGTDLGSGGGGAAAPSFNLVQGSGTNQIASSLQSQDKPIQAYVVSSNVSTAQSLDRNVIETASI